MQNHVKILGILEIVHGAMIALVGLVIFLVLGGVAGFVSTQNDPDAAVGAGIIGAVGAIIPIVLCVVGAPSIIAGIGLLKYQGWARILTIVLSALHLLSFPFGTALGIYGFWVLLKPETEALFRPQAWPTPAV